MTKTRLARKLSLSDAVILGLGSMIGAGIFAATGPAAQAAGSGLLIAIAIAAMAAYFNATSMAQLASLYPESGGTYVYGRKQLGPFWGFLAGWGFVIGKTASCTAMALTFSYYAFPELAKPVAIATVLTITFINYLGVKKTALATKILVTLVLFTLFTIVLSSLLGGDPQPKRLYQWINYGGIMGVLEAAGLMFFAFAGYARVATLGEEVINPKETLPKAILYALGLTILIYFLVIGTTLLVLPLTDIIQSHAPLALAVERSRFSFFAPLVRFGAAIASFGVLLSLLAGISRTIFAMASNSDLPKILSAVHPKHKVPHIAELLVGFIVALLVGFADLRIAIGFSSFAILIYYAIANLSALKLSKENRLYPRFFALSGFLICTILALNLPFASIMGGGVLFILGSIVYLVRRLFI